ncbi:hypothetical protein BGCPKDLD_3831 [Methylorubrum suomiense]|uniref:Transposase n=1 Tax=Methylorubrum suomiense TaxID=144191 RepID=A0ABQ4V0K2_9HYPH|nr:hypothetical protein BGCPKDLD_3831 [Methylorubrum suomiense]
MIRWFKSLFAWRTIRQMGVYAYQQNAVTGKRRAVRLTMGCHSPIDENWLATGEWSEGRRPPPPSALRPAPRMGF